MDFNNTRYIPMSRRRRIYEGKAKVLYEGPEPGTLIQHFKDDATAFNAKKHQVIEGKGVLNDRMVSEEHITAFGWATPQEIDDIMALAIRVNDFLTGLFLGIGIRLVDFKMECG